MATHLGLGQGIRVMRQEITRSTIANWRKDSLVDVIMSFTMAAGSIPGVRGHLEAAHAVALKSPANGGGVDAAIKLLRTVTLQSEPSPTTISSGAVPSEALAQDVHDSAAITAISNEDAPASEPRPLCRSLWKGKACEDPSTCDRVHKPLCSKESCKSARDPSCLDWHYRPKKKALLPQVLFLSVAPGSREMPKGESLPPFPSRTKPSP